MKVFFRLFAFALLIDSICFVLWIVLWFLSANNHLERLYECANINFYAFVELTFDDAFF